MTVIPQLCMARVAELVHRLNDDIILGHFGFEWDTGAVSFHLVEDFRGRLCSAPDIERMLNALEFPLELWQLALRKIRRLEIKPIDAFNAAMIEADANEDDAVVSKGTH